ncbi:MAG: hypothetical protein EOO74_11490 [Myxococcales bacterium]|nr:MAG: hypothetical protein EOO74_11490 [Myxococcales bacterium]
MEPYIRPALGSHVIYVDNQGRRHDALVQHVWATSINLAYILERNGSGELVPDTSVPHASTAQGASGRYWVEPGADMVVTG